MIELTYIDIVISAEAESWNGIDPTRRGRRIIRKSKSGHVLFLQSSLKISTNKMGPIFLPELQKLYFSLRIKIVQKVNSNEKSQKPNSQRSSTSGASFRKD